MKIFLLIITLFFSGYSSLFSLETIEDKFKNSVVQVKTKILLFAITTPTAPFVCGFLGCQGKRKLGDWVVIFT
jgi:hypothetical protein